MIKVLERENKKVTCNKCKAKLQYEQEDIQLDNLTIEYFIVCPDCKNKIYLSSL